jgi:hypothetical protein
MQDASRYHLQRISIVDCCSERRMYAVVWTMWHIRSADCARQRQPRAVPLLKRKDWYAAIFAMLNGCHLMRLLSRVDRYARRKP